MPLVVFLRGEEMQVVDEARRRQLEEERDRLVKKLELLVAESAALGRETMAEGSGQVNDIADEASGTFELEKSRTLERSARNRLVEVEDAIRKIDLGTYGRCEQCGRDIDEERLAVLPEARLCVDCRTRLEKDGRGRLH